MFVGWCLRSVCQLRDVVGTLKVVAAAAKCAHYVAIYFFVCMFDCVVGNNAKCVVLRSS